MNTASNTLPATLQNLLGKMSARLELQSSVEDLVAPILNELRNLNPKDITKIDADIAYIAGLYSWRSTTPPRFPWFKTRYTDRQQLDKIAGLEYIFLFHRDGYVREAALNKICGSLGSPFLFAAIAWRLNDWVSVVRGAAAKCAERTFAQTDASVVASAGITLLARKKSWRRWHGESQLLDKQFNRPDVAAMLAGIIKNDPRGSMAKVLLHTLHLPALDPHLYGIATESIQPSVRALAYRTLIDASASWPNGHNYRWIDKTMGLRRKETKIESRALEIETNKDSALTEAANDRSVMVRRVALTGLIKYRLGTEIAHKLASEMRNDRYPSVAERAEFVLRH